MNSRLVCIMSQSKGGRGVRKIFFNVYVYKMIKNFKLLLLLADCKEHTTWKVYL